MKGRIFLDIAQERDRQIRLWGKQTHSPARWSLILGEEFGEAIREANECEFRTGDVSRLRAELVEVAAVACAWVEDIDGGAP